MQKGEKRRMKKRSLLVLLPLAIIASGCSGNLKKGSIFNAKFMKQNFASAPVAVGYEYKAPEKVDLNLGEGVTVSKYMGGTYDVLTVIKDDVKGYYCLTTNTFAIPLSAGLTSLDSVYTGTTAQMPKSLKFYSGSKVVEDRTVKMVFDDYGNKLYEGHYTGPVQVPMSEVSRYDFDGNEYYVATVIVGEAVVSYAYYNVDRTLKEVLTREEYYKKFPYEAYGASLVDFGHKELRYKSVEQSGEYRYSVYNTKKGKYVSSFVVPQAAIKPHFIGDYLIYQIRRQLPDRAEKYDVNVNDTKYNVETYRVNYLNGKSSKIKTDLYFASSAAETQQKNEKGVKKYLYFEQIQQINKDKTLSLVERDIVVNEKLKIVADVTGINYRYLKLFDKDHLISTNNVIYDFKLKETGVVASNNPGHIVGVNGKYGIADYSGKYVVAPIYDSIELVAEENCYLFETATSWKFGKVNEKGGVDYTRELLKTEYEKYTGSPLVGQFEKFRAFVRTSDSEKVMFDAITGQEIAMVQPLEGSVSYDMMSPEYYLGLASSIKVHLEAYKKDDSYYMIRHYQKINYAFPSMK